MEEFQKPECREASIGYMVRMLNITFRQRFEKLGADEDIDEVTLMHGWIISFLYHNEDQDIYQKTIESRFHIRRSTVSNILQLMEKRGYISREGVTGDARLKKIVLTPQGREISLKIENMIDKMEQILARDIDAKELAVFYQVSEKIIRNLDKQ